MRTIAIINQKGGCGKTTTAINLSAVLAHKGYRTLLVDVDPQGHCALGLAVPDQQLERTIADVLRCGLDGSIAFTDITWQIAQNLDLAPASMSLAGIEQELAGAPDRDRRLMQVLALVSDRYDYCIIDCPPSIGLLTFNALRAAQEVVIPVETGYFAMQGAMRQEATIRMLARRAGHRVRFMVLATMYDVRTKLAREVLAELRRHFGEQLLPVVVHFNSKLREAASFGQAITEYDASCTGHDDFENLADWLIHNPPPPLFPELAGSQVEQSTDGAQTAPSATLSTTAANPVTSGASASANPGATSSPSPPTRTSPAGAIPALSRAAELVERARALAARTAALSARFNQDPALAHAAPSILQPLHPSNGNGNGHGANSGNHPAPNRQSDATPSPVSALSALTQPLPPSSSTDQDSTPPLNPPAITTPISSPAIPTRRPPQPDADPQTYDSPVSTPVATRHDQPRSAIAGPLTQTQPIRMDALAPASATQGKTSAVTQPAPPSVALSSAPTSTLKNQISKLYGVRVTSQGLLFVQPLNSAQSLSVAGDFNHWNPHLHPLMADERLGIWQTCIKVPPGRYRYRLVIDGKWLADPYNPHVETNPFGELNNIIEAAADT